MSGKAGIQSGGKGPRKLSAAWPVGMTSDLMTIAAHVHYHPTGFARQVYLGKLLTLNMPVDFFQR